MTRVFLHQVFHGGKIDIAELLPEAFHSSFGGLIAEEQLGFGLVFCDGYGFILGSWSIIGWITQIRIAQGKQIADVTFGRIFKELHYAGTR
jgi:hypothetical protein